MQVDELGFEPPTGTDQFRLNTYVGNSGDGAPGIDFDGGYASIDDEGYPFIVLSPAVVDQYPDDLYDSGANVVAHELFHTLQFATGSYTQSWTASWYWEATANWVVQYVVPDSMTIDHGAGLYLISPHISVDYFEDPFSPDALAGRQYAAHIFPNHLSEVVGGSELIRESWWASPQGDPLLVLDELLTAYDTDLATEFADFAARITAFDYVGGSAYAQGAADYGQWYGGDDNRVSDVVPEDGTDGWVDAPDGGLKPWAYGYNVLDLGELRGGPLSVGVDPSDTGGQGTPTRLQATVVRLADDEVLYDPIPLDDGLGEVHIEEAGDDVRAYLVVAAVPEAAARQVGERFPYSYYVQVDGPPPSAEAPLNWVTPREYACGCNSGPWTGWAWLVGLIVVGARRTTRSGEKISSQVRKI